MSTATRFDTLIDELRTEYLEACRQDSHSGDATHLSSIEQMGVLIRHQRKKQRLTLQELSDLSDVAYSTLSKIENGDTAVQLRSLSNVLDSLGLKLWIG